VSKRSSKFREGWSRLAVSRLRRKRHALALLTAFLIFAVG